MNKTILILLGLLTIYTISFAQKVTRKEFNVMNDSTEMIDKLNGIDIPEVTISATRFAENKKYIAQQVFTLNKNNINLYSQPTPAELLSQSGQVIVQKSQLGGGSPIISGFEANKVLITVDGIRMNNAIFRGGHLQNVITMDNEAIEKLELLMGPSSVMYGSDALGGVMSFYTTNPEFATGKNTLQAGASVRYASAYNEMHAHADMKAATKKFASFTSLSFSQFGDLRQGKNKYAAFPEWGNDSFNVQTINGIDTMIRNNDPSKQIPTAYSQYDVVQKFIFRTGKIKNTINLQLSTTTDVPRYDRLTEVNSAGIAKSAVWYYGPQQRSMLAWHLELPASGGYDQAKIIAAWQDIKESRHNRNFGSTTLKHRNEYVKVFSLNADFSKRFLKNEWTYGAEVTYNVVNSKANIEDILTGAVGPLDTRYPDGGSHTNSFALYGSLLHKFSKKVVLNAGTRISHSSLYSKFNDTSFFPFPFQLIKQKNLGATGNLALIWLPDNNWKISFLLSNGFRTPNVDDLTKVFESTAGKLIIPNATLKPERTINYEISISKKLNGNWLAGITGWYTDYKNILTTDSGTFNNQSVLIYDGVASPIFTTVNKSKAKLMGFSAKLDGEINNHYYLTSAIHYTYGRLNESPTDYPLDHIAPVYGKLGIGFKNKKFTSEVFSIFNGSKDSANYNMQGEDNNIYSADPLRGFSPSWFTINVRSSLKINSLFTIQLAVENILDKYYRVFASGLGAPGRNFSITIRGKF